MPVLAIFILPSRGRLPRIRQANCDTTQGAALVAFVQVGVFLLVLVKAFDALENAYIADVYIEHRNLG